VGLQPDGADKRISTPYWTREPGMFEHYAENDPASYMGALFHMAGNKLSPALSSIIQAINNKDYRGREIGNMWDKTAYVLKNSFTPISFENASQPNQTLLDVVLDFLGFSQSGKWTTRTPLENQIIATFARYHGGGITAKDVGARKDLLDTYQEAILSKDQNRISQAYQDAKKGGLNDKQLYAASKQAGVPTAKRLFHSIGTENEVEMMKKMSKEDMQAFFPYADKKAREIFREWYNTQRPAH